MSCSSQPSSIARLMVVVMVFCAALSPGLWPATAAAAPPLPLSPQLQRGEQVYARCLACHAIEGNHTGPQHCGLFGRRAGTAPGYEDQATPALRASGIVWNAASLDRFLTAPTEVVPGTAMAYAGVKDAGERADLIAWLAQATEVGRACRLRP